MDQFDVTNFMFFPGIRPFRVLILTFLVTLVASEVFYRLGWTERMVRSSRWLLIGLSACLVTFYAICVISYATTDFISDHGEANVISVAWLWWQGCPMYHAPSTPWRYAMIYGPWMFAGTGAALGLFGPSIVAAKVPAAVAILAGLGLLFSCLRSSLPSFGLRLVVVAYAAICLMLLTYIPQNSYWARPDPYLVLFTVVGLYASSLRGLVPASLLCGIALGLAMGFKPHALLYHVPVLGLLLRNHGWRSIAISAPVAAVMTVLPFLTLREVSLSGYLYWLQNAGRHPLLWQIFTEVVKSLVLCSIPFVVVGILVLSSGRRPGFARLTYRDLLVVASFLGPIGIMLVPASKAGCGPHHMLPFVPVFAYALAISLNRLHDLPVASMLPRRAAVALGAAWISICTITVVDRQADSLWQRGNEQRFARGVLREIDSVLSHYPGRTIGMGYGSKYRPTVSYRVGLIFRGQPCLIDPTALADMQEGGLEIPAATLEALEYRMVEVWLIPRGDKPFSGAGYDSHRTLYDDAFRDRFSSNYTYVRSHTYFDVYVPDVAVHRVGKLESGDIDRRFRHRRERGDRVGLPVCFKAGCEVVQHVPPLLPAGGHHRRHPLHEPAPLFTVGTPADSAPDHRMRLGALRRVVLGRHIRDPRRSTDSPPGAGSRRWPRWSSGRRRRPVLQGRIDITPQPGHRRGIMGVGTF